MKIRHISKKYEYLADFTSSVAFEFEYDYLKAKAECENEGDYPFSLEMPPDGWSGIYFGAFTDDESECMAVVQSTPYKIRLDGGEAYMGGVGGVASLPHHRGTGAVNEVMLHILREDRRRGYALDYLFPFSRAYYRRYGFENAEDCRDWDISFKAINELIKTVGEKGRFAMLNAESDLSVLDKIRDRAWDGVNLSTIGERASGNYKGKLEKNKIFVYVYFDEDDTPRGYIAFDNDGGVMNCINNFGHPADFIFDTPDTLRQMLRFSARAFNSRYHTLRVRLPDFVRLNTIVPELNSARSNIYAHGMARILNPEDFFGWVAPKGGGEFNVAVTDSFLPENNGVYKISFEDGECSAQRCDGAPDIECDIQSLTLLGLGIFGIEEAEYLNGVKIINPDKPYDAVFYRRKNYVTSLF